MPFTLYHYKDGKKIPITMSIWDAFHGVPNPKPRKPKPCACCGNFHTPKQTNKDSCKEDVKKGDGNKDGTNEAGDGGDGGKPKNYSAPPSVEFTAEDDAKILQLKVAGNTWNQIRDAVGKGSKSQITARYKELSQHTATTQEGKKEEEKKQEEKKAIGEQKKAANIGKKENEGKTGKKDKAKADRNKDVKAGDKDSNIKAWADGLDKQKWIAVASKHFDKTGERITPEAARAMAEGKA